MSTRIESTSDARASFATPPSGVRRRRLLARGFTLVELLVATTAGLFVAVAAFTLAKQSSTFFQAEARVATAQFTGTLGFERLRADIARAGYMSSPAIRFDPALCGDPTNTTWVGGLQSLAALRITQDLYSGDSFNAANGISPDRIDIAGSFASAELFPIRTVEALSTGAKVYFQVSTGAFQRASGGITATTGPMPGIFQPGRIVRLVDPTGHHLYSTIRNGYALDGNGNPYVDLGNTPSLTWSAGTNGGSTGSGVGSGACGVPGTGTGMSMNVVNWIRYEIRNLSSPPTGLTGLASGDAGAGWAPLYDAGNGGIYASDPWKRDLIRVELDPTSASNGSPTMTEFANTFEVVGENAVDLRFGLSYQNGNNAGSNVDPVLATLAPGATGVGTIAGAITTGSPATNQQVAGTGTCGAGASGARPHCIRSVRVRLGIRAREFDRAVNTTLASSNATQFGMLRVGIPDGGAFARVRNLVADVQLPNLAGVTW